MQPTLKKKGPTLKNMFTLEIKCSFFLTKIYTSEDFSKLNSE